MLFASGSLAPAQQHYLLQARQMQAMSFAVHIPLVAFAIAFPVLVLFVEGLWLRTGDSLYLTLARRWSRIMVALFAVGVITGTVLSFEMGLLWPNFTGTFGSVFGLGFAIEGFSFFVEAIFIGIYVYGWGRLSPRLHLLTGVPIVITGFTGSWMVISVNAWMNHPSGFRLQANGKVVDVNPWKALFANSYLWHELIHMYIAGYIVTGSCSPASTRSAASGDIGAATSAPRWRFRSRSRRSRRPCRFSSATGRRVTSPPPSPQSSRRSRACPRRRAARPSTSAAGT
ncbi:MAG TPA: cytochrome ubiquinol oxidase subunit I, partial [Gaiellaceae bacterium]